MQSMAIYSIYESTLSSGNLRSTSPFSPADPRLAVVATVLCRRRKASSVQTPNLTVRFHASEGIATVSLASPSGVQQAADLGRTGSQAWRWNIEGLSTPNSVWS